jgi:hypothetical protein
MLLLPPLCLQLTSLKAAIWRMICIEARPDKMMDPEFIEMKEVNRVGSYYLNLKTGEVRRTVKMYPLPRGGLRVGTVLAMELIL